jgi:hypothetical protein
MSHAGNGDGKWGNLISWFGTPAGGIDGAGKVVAAVSSGGIP